MNVPGSGCFQVGSCGSANQSALGVIKLFFLMLDKLAVELIYQEVDRRVHVLMFGIGNYLAACHMQCGFGFLLEFFDLENNLDGNDAIKMAFQSLALLVEVGTKRVRSFPM